MKAYLDILKLVWPLALGMVNNALMQFIDRAFLARESLESLEAVLPASFLRINKSALANMDHLDRFSSSYSGAVDAVFACGYTEYVSRRCFAQIKRRFMEK